MSDLDKILKGGAAVLKTPFRANPALEQLAMQVLERVRTGQITSLACVTVDSLGQIGWPGCGMQTAELYIGADMMMDDMKAAMKNQGGNRILRG